MRTDRIVRWLAVAGAALFAIALLLGATGHAVGLGNGEIGSLVLAGSLVVFAIAAGLGAMDRSRTRSTRIGMAMLAVGIFMLVASGLIGAGMPYDPLESWPVVIMTLGGLAATFLGVVVTTVALSMARASRARG